MDINAQAIELHKKFQGKLETVPKAPVTSREELSVVYTPGVAAVCKEIEKNKPLVNSLTLKGRTIAIVSDGSAVLGLGNIGPEAGMPVMEGKAVLFKTFGGVDAFPLCLATQDTQEIIKIVKSLVPTFAGINLEDISAPRCFEIEDSLQDIGIPVMHDDQAGAAMVTLAALLNAVKVLGKPLKDMKVVINGAGAAGIAIARMLYTKVSDLLMVDSAGTINRNRTDLNIYKKEIAECSNKNNLDGSLRDALKDADIFIGVSKGNLLKSEDIRLMNKDPVIFALANPIPEIMPEDAQKGGAKIVGTGRSDYPNQINNSLAFPGVFKGALKAGAKRITPQMKMAAALAISDFVTNPTVDKIVPSMFDPGLADTVAEAVEKASKI